jgi:hypothetical protein
MLGCRMLLRLHTGSRFLHTDTFAPLPQLLQANGYPDMSPLDDINTEQEKALGKLIKTHHGTDFYILTEFPLCVRPFYTMPCPHDKELSNSFDVFMRGEVCPAGVSACSGFWFVKPCFDDVSITQASLTCRSHSGSRTPGVAVPNSPKQLYGSAACRSEWG